MEIDEAPLQSADVDATSRTLGEIGEILQARQIEQRVTLFRVGTPEIRGQLEGAGDVFIGPDVCVTLRWLGADDTPNHVTANTSELPSEGD